jgi:hypothetical protein
MVRLEPSKRNLHLSANIRINRRLGVAFHVRGERMCRQTLLNLPKQLTFAI